MLRHRVITPYPHDQETQMALDANSCNQHSGLPLREPLSDNAISLKNLNFCQMIRKAK